MNSPEHSDGPNFTSIADLLISVVNRDNELAEEAHRKLHVEQEMNGYFEAVLQRAELLADLPDVVRAYKDKGGNVPDRVERFAESYAALARQFIEEGNTFGMSTLLTSWGSKKDEPNDLERLAYELSTQTDSAL